MGTFLHNDSILVYRIDFHYFQANQNLDFNLKIETKSGN